MIETRRSLWKRRIIDCSDERGLDHVPMHKGLYPHLQGNLKWLLRGAAEPLSRRFATDFCTSQNSTFATTFPASRFPSDVEPSALHLRFAAAGQLCRPADTVAARPEDNNAFVCHQVSLASGGAAYPDDCT
ncbi:hypothetical protein [Mesorhizobium sp. M1273]|uniref:hypothetical protein n=1 Tax=Mesorhizobium sp. M1273 TaxID=2957075 RepID=UPI00333680A4